MSQYNASERTYQEVAIMDRPALFTELRIDRSSVPEGVYRYELRHSDEDWGEPIELSRSIAVNFYGTVLTREPFQLPIEGWLPMEPDSLSFQDGGCRTLAAFQQKYPASEKDVIDFYSVNDPSLHDFYFSRSREQDEAAGCIGHLRGDMDKSGNGFFTSWWDHCPELKTQVFKDEFDDFINALRFDDRYGGIFKNRSSLSRYCYEHKESVFAEDFIPQYGFRVDTPEHAYLLRLNPMQGDYNLYVYCYRREALDRHLKNAERGICFVDPQGKTLFRIPDGDSIRVLRPDGTQHDHICQYIDDHRAEIGSGHLYGIVQFAQQMEQTGSTFVPLRSSLPKQCYSLLLDTGNVVILKRGETGYYKTDIPHTSKEEARAIVEEYNRKLGVTRAQEEAMKGGSMFGFDKPIADPANYDAQGQPLKRREKDRGDTR